MNEKDRHLISVLRRLARTKPNEFASRYLRSGETVAQTLTYAELDERARAVAAHLLDRKQKGSPVLLLYSAGVEYLCAFMGCLYAGAIAVPAYPPGRHHTHRLKAIVEDAKPNLVLCDSELKDKLYQLVPDITGSGVDLLETESMESSAAADWQMPAIAYDSLAFLQYTSGSTGAPKGVMVSHGNLMANLASIDAVLPHPERAPHVSWLPLYHDMGLIGISLHALYVNAPVILMSPSAFMEKPLRWLRAVSDYHAHSSGGPNFAYELCVSRIAREECEGLDLSHWRVAFNGAEPIQAHTLKRFTEKFSPFGFRPEAMWPCYGMAETTLFISGIHHRETPRIKSFDADALSRGKACAADRTDAPARELVSCGTNQLTDRVVVVNPSNRNVCQKGEIGEIWVSGPSVAKGYWRKPALTRDTFEAQIAGDGERRYLRTGDLGFFYNDELYPTGRLKDLIIVRGLNIYPQDLERRIEQCHTEIRAFSTAAFAIDTAVGESLAMVCEINRGAIKLREEFWRQLCRSIRRELASAFEIRPEVIVLVPPAVIPKTSSGKIMRQPCKQRWLAGDLNTVFEDRLDHGPVASATLDRQAGPHSALQTQMLDLTDTAQKQSLLLQFLREQSSRMLGADAAGIGEHETLVSLGLDSLQSVNLKHALDELLQREIPLSDMMDDISLGALAAKLAQLSAGAKEKASANSGDGGRRPLSEGQKAAWFVQQQHNDSIAHNIHLALRIRSPLDHECLKKSFAVLLRRHGALRTAYREQNGIPYQSIMDDLPDVFDSVDVSGQDEAQLQQAIKAVITTPFSLDQGEVIRICLLHRGNCNTTLVLCAHHIALDFWSLVLLVRELGVLYRARGIEAEAELPATGAGYTDFVDWQECMLERDAAEHWRYWSRQLGGELTTLTLPFDRPRPAQPNFHGASVSLRLDEQTHTCLKRIAIDANATLFTLLLSAFAALLHRYSGQGDFIIGIPTSGRVQKRFANTVGYFVNPVAMRLRPASDQPFTQFLNAVRLTTLSALKHQDYPFSTIVERINPERNADRYPFYQLAFTLQTAQLAEQRDLAALALGEAGAAMQWGGLRVESMALDERVENFDLKLVMAEARDGLNASFQYNRDLFDANTIETLARHFACLLDAIAAQPNIRLRDIPLIDATEYKHLIHTATSREIPDTEEPVHQQVARQAVVRPNAVALAHKKEKISYAHLDAMANRLAHYLASLRAGPEKIIAIYLPRGIDYVLSALAVLKTGSAYLPIDTAYPAARTAAMLNKAAVTAVITLDDLAPDLAGASVRLFLLDRDRAVIETQPKAPFKATVSPDNSAYLIFTSGSSGQPKGVTVSHRALANLVAWHKRAYQLKADDRASQLAGAGFDASVWEVWPYLATGASLHIVSDTDRQEPKALLAWLQRQAITHCFLPTPLAEAVLKTDWPKNMALNVLLTGGDRLGVVNENQRPVRLVNHYGPTENTVVSSCCDVDWRDARLPPIGRAIDHVTLYIVDRDFNPLPVGCEGDLYIGGAALARGYHDQPGLTADRFLPDPFALREGARMYRSGDRACFRKDGQIEYRGRTDQQLKVRGFRIEPAEIEQALHSQPGVVSAAVLMQPAHNGDPQLCAYIVADTNRIPSQLNEHEGMTAAHVGDWARLYQDTYQQCATDVDADFNIIGWNSSYTDQPIPSEEMRCWIESTVAGIRELKPRRVLEVGCGTGLVLTRIAPNVDAYHATDISQTAVDRLVDLVERRGWRQVSLECNSADRKPALPQRVDTVIVNSVVQYFPNPDYLLQMLDQTLPEIIPGGRLFIGDVRNHRLLRTFHVDVQTHKSRSSLKVAELARLAAASSGADHELVFDPRFFIALKKRYSRISHVEIRHKRGDFDNELSRYRYDVVLHIEAEREPNATPWRDWIGVGDVEKLRELLREEQPQCLALRAIPNARLSHPVALVSAIDDQNNAVLTVEELHGQIVHSRSNGVDPYVLCELAESLGYKSKLLVSQYSERGLFDVVLRRGAACAVITDMDWACGTDAQDLSGYANDPLRTRCLNQWAPLLRDALGRLLPDYMAPRSFVFLDALPFTANGKLDRRALPLPDAPSSAGRHIESRSDTEQRLCEIWRQVLGVTRVGVQDNFFELGGDSILSIQVVSRARDAGLHMNTRRIFEHQTIETLARALDAQGAIADGLRRGAVTIDDAKVIELGARFNSIEAVYPLSPLQKGLWFQSSFDQDQPVYIEQLHVALEGTLKVEMLRAAWRRVQARHAVLRTAFDWLDDNQAVQIVLPFDSVSLPFYQLDWRAFEDPYKQLKAFLEQDYHQPFSTRQAPLMRVSLIRTTANRYHMIWTHHHLLLDGWSVPLLLGELFEIYEAEVNGQPLELVKPDAYRDFIDWLSQADQDAARSFWQNTLAGFDEPLSLRDPRGVERKEPVNNGMRQSKIEWDIDFSAELQTFCRRSHITLNTLLQGAWALLLSTHTGRRDVVFGMVDGGRQRAVNGIDRMVGLLINSVPLRIQVQLNQTAAAWLEDVQKRTLAVSEYSYSALPDIQRWSDCDAESPLFETLLAFENYPLTDFRGKDFAGVSLRDVEYRDETHYPMTLVITPGKQLQIAVGYQAARFSAAGIEVLVAHFKNLVNELVAWPHRKLANLSAVDAKERALLAARSESQTQYPVVQSLTARFAQQAAQRGDAVALVKESRRISYAELDRQSNQLARALTQQGIGVGDKVALCLDRSPMAVAAMLAVLKAGAAYVPLDPRYPCQRLIDTVKDAEAGLLLVDEKQDWQQALTTPVLSLAEVTLEAYENRALVINVDPQWPAYIIYTSGSTGRPKGVCVTHAQVMRLFSACGEHFEFNADDAWSQFHSIAFDFSVWEIWGALLHGARCVLAPYWISRSPRDFRDLINAEGVTVLSQTPSAFRQLQDIYLKQGDAAPGRLRYVVFGGEALEAAHLKDWFKCYGDEQPQLINMYGITETTVHVTSRRISRIDVNAGVSNIGRPLADLSTWVLDSSLQPAPVGVIGELYVGGAGVAQGYAGRAALSAERFIPDPWSLEPGARLYRTGDLACYRPDGSLEYHGRCDAQIKLRGHRIETGEIRHALINQPTVTDAVVMLHRNDQTSRTRLVAWVTGEGVDEETLKTAISEQLPSWMAPQDIVYIDSFPLTANGKLDYRALPKPGDNEKSEMVAAGNEIEARLLAVWREVLDVETIGVSDNFFELGGDSILSMQVVNRARQQGIDLSPRQLFENPDVRSLARVAGHIESEVTLAGELARGSAPLTPIQRWFFDQPLNNYSHWNQAVMLAMDEGRDTARLEKAWRTTVIHHDSFRLRYRRDDEGWHQFYDEAAQPSALEIVDLSTHDPLQRNQLLAERCQRAQQSLDIEQGLVIRALYFRRQPAQNDQLLICAHHLVIDGVSWRILLEDLESAYQGLAKGAQPALREKTASFKDWSLRLADYAAGETLQSEYDYWKGLPWTSVETLRPDYPEAGNSEGEQFNTLRCLTTDETRSLLADAPRAYGTQINDLLLTALARCIASEIDAALVRVDVEGHGRENLFAGMDVSRTIGWFTTQYPVLLDTRKQDIGEAIKQVKESLRAIPNQGIGFGILRHLADYDTRARLERLPGASVCFNYLGQFESYWADSSPLFAASGSAASLIGEQHAVDNTRYYDIDINAAVVGGQLFIHWAGGPRYERARIEAFADRYSQALLDVIKHCLSPDAGGFTPSDFPLADQLDQQALNSLLDEL